MQFTSIREVLVPRRLAEISPENTLNDAFELMDRRRVTALVVTVSGRLLGILCAQDIIRHVSQHGGLGTTRVTAAMTGNVICVETRDCLTDVSRILREAGFSHVPVLDLTGRVIGILHRSDIPYGTHTAHVSTAA